MHSHEPSTLFVPGRLCLLGEHSDWAAELGQHAGYCIVVGTDQGLGAQTSACDKFVVESLVADQDGRPTGRTRRMECPWSVEALLEAARDEYEFFRYCAGVAHQMFSQPGVKGGVEIRITRMDLPLRKGVSSSAAVCMLVARAFDAVYGLRMFPHELMEVAYFGERLTGSQCGRMDQACVYGKVPVLLTFQKGERVRVEPVFCRRPVYLFFVDLAGSKDTVKILQSLQQAYPANEDLRQALGPSNEGLARDGYAAITGGDPARLGEIMNQAQANFDKSVARHCPDELASPLLHQVLSLDGLWQFIYGGKCVGSGGDGTAQFVAQSSQARQDAMELIGRSFPQMRCFPLTIDAQP